MFFLEWHFPWLMVGTKPSTHADTYAHLWSWQTLLHRLMTTKHWLLKDITAILSPAGDENVAFWWFCSLIINVLQLSSYFSLILSHKICLNIACSIWCQIITQKHTCFIICEMYGTILVTEFDIAKLTSWNFHWKSTFLLLKTVLRYLTLWTSPMNLSNYIRHIL